MNKLRFHLTLKTLQTWRVDNDGSGVWLAVRLLNEEPPAAVHQLGLLLCDQTAPTRLVQTKLQTYASVI